MKKLPFILSLIITFNANALHTCGDDLNNNCWDCAATESDSCTARLENGILTVSGTGKMRSFPDGSGDYCAEENICWNHLREEITSVVVEEGITQIGRNAFETLPITSATLPSTLEVLGAEAFQRSRLTSLDLPEGLEELGGRMFFWGGVPLTAIAVPDSLLSSGKFNLGAFEESNVNTLYCSKEKEQACADYINAVIEAGYKTSETLKYQLYKKCDSGYLYKGKFYNRLGDIGTTNHIKKRIYTIEEANQVAGPVNRVSITYR